MVVLLVYVNDFCYYINCLYTTGTGTALRKNRSMRVPIYSIDSIAPRIWFGLANRVGPGKGCDN